MKEGTAQGNETIVSLVTMMKGQEPRFQTINWTVVVSAE